MMMVRSCLAPTATGGLGLFTVGDIARGELVWMFDARYDLSYFHDDLDSMPVQLRDTIDRFSFPHPTDPERIVMDCDEGRFLHISETPNIEMSRPGRGIATCLIKAGELLTRAAIRTAAPQRAFPSARRGQPMHAAE